MQGAAMGAPVFRKSRRFEILLKPKNGAASDVVIVLMVLAGVDVKRGRAAPVIASFEAEAQAPQAGNLHIHAHTRLKHAGRFASASSIGPEEHQVFTGGKVPDPAAKAEPGGDRQVGNQVEPRSRSYE